MRTPKPVSRGLITFAAAVIALAAPAAACAQEEFPGNKPIEMTVLFPAGTSADVTARVLAEGMSRQLNTNIVVVNRPGAGGAIGYKYLAAQTPDGHHIVWNSNSISTSYHSGMLAFDYKAFDLVAQVQVETPLLVVKADAPWKGLREFVAAAKANPGKITVGNSGVGSHTHMTSIALFRAAGAEVLDVPFGAAQVIPSLLGGHVQAVVQLPSALISHVKAGSLRVLAALSVKRDTAFPEVPTAREQGINIGAELWRGIAVPKGTPKKIIARLEDAVRKTVANPEFVKSSERMAVNPAFLPVTEFGKVVVREDAEIAQMMRLLGLKKSAN
ncbi:MAG: tripartite tricarboxylate transporter substrate binding protein [Gallionella sp.]|nr:tripartite tricarboxylate transporter substrate binding protein [Gallionella sp.]